MPQEWLDHVKKIKEALRKKSPDMDEKKLDSEAYAIATKQWEEKYGTNPRSGEKLSQKSIDAVESFLKEYHIEKQGKAEQQIMKGGPIK